MPAEWEPHSGTWIAWPHNRSDWPGKFEAIPWVYSEIVFHLAHVENVHILIDDEAAEERARKILDRANALRESVIFHRWPTNRVWTRDFGPIFLKRVPHSSGVARSLATARAGSRPRAAGRHKSEEGEVALLNFGFTAWAKYPDWERDDKIPAQVARTLKMREWRPEIATDDRSHRIVLEGGSIDVNGAGTMLTTEECLLSDQQQRNPGIGREQLERAFHDYLGASKVIWLGRGIVGDDTHGHIDDIARFAAPDVVLAAYEPNPADANFAPLQENLQRLREATDQDGRRLRIVKLPMPRAIVFRGQRLPASYANFYIANGIVLVPTFNDPNDRVALNLLAGVFPDREIIGIYCGDLIWGLGALHCMTQQQPR